jgi:hypothetical protein
MAKCSYCRSTILFGGVKDGDLTFCNEKCQETGVVVRLASQLPDEVVQSHVVEVHQSSCPKCGGAGPVDVHTSYRVWSMVLMTSWNSSPQICCKSCGVKARLGDAAFCLFLGWWGFPWGLIMTPVQLAKNVGGLFSSPDPNRPSEALTSVLRANMAADFLAQRQQQSAAAAG